MKRTLSLFLAAVFALGLLAGCGRPGDVYKKQGEAPAPPQEAAFKVGLVPDVDALPLWVAEQQGFFQNELLKVELVSFKSAKERDAALAAGAIDGMLADLVEATAVIGQGARARIVAATMGATPAERPVVLLAGKGTGITAAGGLRGQAISLPPGTALAYAAEQLLLEKGLQPGDVRLVEAEGAAALVEALAAGQVKGALLPEPYASLAAGRGAAVLASEAEAKGNYTQSVLVFTEAAIAGKGDGITRFFRAHNMGAADLRIEHDRYMELLTEKTGLPITIKVAYHRSFPVSLTARPKQEELDRAAQWLVSKKLIPAKVTYQQAVNTGLLPASAQ